MPAKKTSTKKTVQNNMYDSLDSQLPMKVNFPNPFAPQILSEAIKISRIGHTFTRIPDGLVLPGDPPQFIVQDFLIDQTGFTGAAKMRVPFETNLNQYGRYRIHLLPKGYNGIRVSVPDGAMVFFNSQLFRRVIPPGGGDFYDASPARVRFTQLSAAAPIITYNNFSITHATNNSLGFSIEGQVNNSFSFYDLILRGSYAPRLLSPASAMYNAFSWAQPFGLPAGNSGVAFVMFGYITTNSIDPGPFVKIF